MHSGALFIEPKTNIGPCIVSSTSSSREAAIPGTRRAELPQARWTVLALVRSVLCLQPLRYSG